MEPLRLVVDWTTWQDHSGEPAEVWLYVGDREPQLIHRHPNPPDAAGWARRWMEGRGLRFWSDIDTAQAAGWTCTTLYSWSAPHTRPSGR